jgi:hypothetical protein
MSTSFSHSNSCVFLRFATASCTSITQRSNVRARNAVTLKLPHPRGIGPFVFTISMLHAPEIYFFGKLLVLACVFDAKDQQAIRKNLL